MSLGMRRLILGALMPVVVAAAGLGPYLAYGPELPDRVAVHYDSAGVPDGSMAREQFLVLMGAMMAIGLATCAAIAYSRRKFQPMVAPGACSVGAFLAALCAGILTVTAVDQRGLDRWQDAALSPAVLILWICASVATAAFAAWLASSLPHRDGNGVGAPPPAMALASGERVFWSGTLSVRWPLLAGLTTVAVALVLTQFADFWIVIIALVVASVITTFGRIRVTADRSGLGVRYGLLGWPRTSVPVGRIAAARVIDVRPTEWGGWGYRGSLALMRRAAVVLREGPGIRLDLHDGKVFAVTVDHPDTPVRLLNAEIERLAAAGARAPGGSL